MDFLARGGNTGKAPRLEGKTPVVPGCVAPMSLGNHVRQDHREARVEKALCRCARTVTQRATLGTNLAPGFIKPG